MPETSPQHIHLIGICGTAMGSIASLLKEQGHHVTGSDAKVYPPMSTFLESREIEIMEGYDPKHLDPAPDLVIVGNAISRGNPELEYLLDAKLSYSSLPECLKQNFLQSSHNLVVTGTHGKTTTTSLLAWLLKSGGLKPGYFIGGIPLNFDSGCQFEGGNHWVIEGDEYDTAFFDKRSKFLHYQPELVIINNIEFDHADIYENLEQIKRSFRQLVNIIPRNGALVVNGDDANVRDVIGHAQARIVDVGFEKTNSVVIELKETDENGTHFRIMDHDFVLPLYGRHNVHNAAVALCAAHAQGLSLDALDTGLRSFKGIKRRLEVRGEPQGITIIDDFAHHPTAIQETLKALRLRYPERKLWALFEPRSNTTRRATFQDSLPEALSEADAVYLGPVARAEQIAEEERLKPEQVISDLISKGIPSVYGESTEVIIQSILPQLKPGDVVAVLSNGSFDGLIEQLLDQLNQQ
ncbi:MAG: UDP-N-acetylmuramate:L-alanyl-gamma-D-glutamyl-meso-diaminopimelate ligase [Verrucomicrobiota bacterium]